MGSINGSVDEARADALTAETKTHIFDTCMCIDTGQWETGIKPKGKPWIIVEQYDGKNSAIKGHKKWFDIVNKNPKVKLKDVMEYGF